MFIPGDPVEQRKMALLKKLAGGGRNAGGGFRVGRQAGQFGGGLRGGQGGHGQGLPGMLQAYGQGGGFQGGGDQSPGFSSFGQAQGGGPNTGQHPLFGMGGDMMQPPFGMQQSPVSQNPLLIQQLLQQYGQQPQPFSAPGKFGVS